MQSLHDVTGHVLYQSNTAKTFREALVEAVKLRIPLPRLNLDNRDLTGLTQLAGLRAPGASCRNTNFSKCNLEGAYMPESNCTGANFSLAHAPEADLSGSDVTEAKMVGTNLTGGTLDGIHGKAVRASEAILDFASVRHADLLAINLDQASMISADWTGSKLLAASLFEVTATHSKLDEVDGTRAKFVNADLRWSSMSGQFTFANFSGANLNEVTVNGDIDLAGAIFDNAQGVGPELSAEAVRQHLLARIQNRAPERVNKPPGPHSTEHKP